MGTTVGFIDRSAHPSAKGFFDKFRVETTGLDQTMTLDQVVEFPQMTLEGLLDQILALRPSTIMTVHHGAAGGIIIPLKPGIRFMASDQALTILANGREVEADVARMMSLTLADVARLRAKMDKVRSLHLESVEIRGCFVGSWMDTLRAVQFFFGSRSVNAPKVRDAFGRAAIQVASAGSPQWIRFKARSNVRVIEPENPVERDRRLLIYILPNHQTHTFQMEIMAESESALAWWVAAFMPSREAITADAMRKHGWVHLQITEGKVHPFSKEPAYADNLRRVSGPPDALGG